MAEKATPDAMGGDAPSNPDATGTKLTGRPVQLISINDENHSYVLNEEALQTLFNDENVREKPVCVVSVAGAFRKGKSFLLDFLLRYLHCGGAEGWIGEDRADQPLEGFLWRGGSERLTTGVLVWSEVFTVKTESGKSIAVVLMDTQGAFDSNSTVKDCATIFALSAMVSSVLVYNLSANIQEDDLQHLQLFTEYGRLAMEDSGDRPFQRLQFLVRDWSYPYEAVYGSEGGKKILERRLEVSDKQHPELQALRKHISSCFDRIDGFLLPHPGLKVSTDPRFSGQLKDIEPEFVKHLSHFVPLLLAPENLQVRKISGTDVRCKDLIRYLRAYVEIFRGDEMPEPKSMLEATSEANNLASLSEAKDSYVAGMERVCGGEKPYLNERLLEMEHLRVRDAAMETFDARRKMGGAEFSAKYREQLEKELDDSFVMFRQHNEGKNIFKAAGTPLTLAALAMMLYLASQVLGLLGLYPIANLLNLAMVMTFATLGAWAYLRYSGNMPEVGGMIDEGATMIWESVLERVLDVAAKKFAEQTVRPALQRPNSTTSKKSK